MSFVNKMPSTDVICNKCIHKNVCYYVAYDIHNCANFLELVKCEDCKHRSKVASEDTYDVELYVCNHEYGCAKCDDGDFCHYGERKTRKRK